VSGERQERNGKSELLPAQPAAALHQQNDSQVIRSPLTADRSPLFVLVAGEASGDLLGAGLINSLRERFPLARFAGVGGPQMAAAGMDIWYPAERLSVMGLAEVLAHLPGLLWLRRDVCKRVLLQRPAAFIGIDAPDFNLGLERRLKRARIRTAHYVSPSIWAWREQRAATIGMSADRVLCLFPMEPPIYAQYHVDARFVGHPLADAFAMNPDQAAARRQLGLPADAPVLALLPGSRLGEIRRLGRDFLAAASQLKRQLPQLHIVAPMANAACRKAFEALVRDSGFGIRDAGEQGIDTHDRIWLLSSGSTLPYAEPSASIESRIPNPESPLQYTAMIAADAVLVASGTAALEVMLAKRPMVVAYRVAPLTHWIVKTFGLLRTDVYSLPNILAGKKLVPELMQNDCKPAALADALLPLLRARALPPPLLSEFQQLHNELRGDADHSAAAAIADLIAADSAGASH
jgi:lipid-A-disaccharide synthase